MPSFAPEVRDLVARILSTDVQKRYTITQIKNHPAFRTGLPKDYTLPEPLPEVEVPALEVMDEWSLEKVVGDLKIDRPGIETLPWPRKAAKAAEKRRKVRAMEEVRHRREFVLRTVQQCAGGAGFDWFHPDDTEIICRRPSDGLAMKAEIGGCDESAKVNIRLERGEEEEFDIIANRIVVAVQRMPADQPSEMGHVVLFRR
jgi:hypothetical protein